MAEEGLVLGGDEGVEHQRREFVIGQLDPALAGEGLDRIAVIAADVGRQRRLIGEQASASSAGRWRNRATRAAKKANSPSPVQVARRTSVARNHGSTRACTRRLNATRSGSGQCSSSESREVHLASPLARDARRWKADQRVRRAATSVSIACASASTSARAVLGRAQQRFIVDIAEIAGLEQHRRRTRAAQDVEGGEAVRVRANLRSGPRPGRSCRTARLAEADICARMTRSESSASTDPSPLRSSPALSERGAAPPLRRRRRCRTASKRLPREQAGCPRCPCGVKRTSRH